MSPSNSLYEPKLVDQWIKRYRDFETDEKIRSLKNAIQERKSPLPARQREIPQDAA